MDGGARSALWRQIICDVLGRPLSYAPGAARGSAHGVAIVAGAAVGLWGWQGPPTPGAGEQIHEPDPVAGARYRALYQIYRDLYPRLRGDFAALARVQ
jgi:sugar (pentulose or hexulose) kinase